MRYYRDNTRKSIGRAVQPSVQTFTIPACTSGVNTLTNISSMEPTDCLWAYNLMPSEIGMELRQGYKEWVIGIGGVGTEDAVRGMVPYDGVQANHSDDRLFCTTSEGIYDVTDFNQTDPTPELTWPITGGDKAGHCSWINFSNDAEEHFVYLADVENGLYQYTASTELWAAVTGLTVDDGLGTQVPWTLETDVTYVTAHKLRLWLTVDDSGDGWYLPVESGAGEVFKFTFGSKFKHGGYLMGLWSWSYESTNGLQDYLIAVSRGGDVLIYRGSDPTQPDWTLVGSYYIGEVTNSRNIAMNYGAEMYLLSTYGITAVTDLLKGVEAYLQGPSPTAKIARALRTRMITDKESKYWQMAINPTEGFLQIIAPYDDVRPEDAVHYNQNLLTQAWGYWRGVPMTCAAPQSGAYYFGTLDGRVMISDGTADNVTLAGDPGLSIPFEVFTAFNAGGSPATFKRVGYIRTLGILEGQANLSTNAVYDYKIQFSTSDPGAAPTDTENAWDTALWDEALWDYSAAGSDVTIGSLGMGRMVAISLKGSSSARIVVSGWDVMFTGGGLL